MSATIYWRPCAKNERSFSEGISSDLDVLTETFGSRIDLGDLDKLRAMYAASKNKLYLEIIEAVEKHEAIEIWGSW